MAVAKKKFDPASLSVEDQEAVIELYLGIHPRYFVYRNSQQGLPGLEVDIYTSRRDRKDFNGFLPNLKKMGII
jgi:hypothetical protein